eukprot:2341406-Alexandrium_andersonii.AAC.1
MSASLVGSEMCIRDSAGTAEAARARLTAAGAPRAAAHARRLAQRDYTAVSYTHLTLPTICSV